VQNAPGGSKGPVNHRGHYVRKQEREAAEVVSLLSLYCPLRQLHGGVSANRPGRPMPSPQHPARGGVSPQPFTSLA
jgi:hypothetical protein